MKIFLFAIAILFGSGATTSIYTFTVPCVNGTAINFDSFQGKKILLVNIATGSPRTNQVGTLQALYSQYADSMVIVAFPSNSFGFETRSDEEIKAYCETHYGTTFHIAAKGDVSGEQRQPIFNWLASSSENGVVSAEIHRDFQKVLIDTDGSIIGLFSHNVDPMDSVIQKAILGIE